MYSIILGSLLHTPLFGERRPATDCSRMRKLIGYFPRKISHKTLLVFDGRGPVHLAASQCLLSLCYSTLLQAVSLLLA